VKALLSGLLVGMLSIVAVCRADPETSSGPPAEGSRYSIIAAQSARSIDNPMYLCNLNGQLALVYDLKNVARGSDYGISGSVWIGRADPPGTTFEIKHDDLNTGVKYRGQKIGYADQGQDNTVNLNDGIQATSWEMASVRPEWFRKYRLPSMRPFHLRATQGKFKGYYLTFDEPELVKIDEDRSYVRRRAVLTQEPTELSVLLKQEHRER
jgi:hypothetical protein